MNLRVFLGILAYLLGQSSNTKLKRDNLETELKIQTIVISINFKLKASCSETYLTRLGYLLGAFLRLPSGVLFGNFGTVIKLIPICTAPLKVYLEIFRIFEASPQSVSQTEEKSHAYVGLKYRTFSSSRIKLTLIESR